MKHYSPLAWMMAIAIAGTVTTACSLDGYEPEKPFTTDPVEKPHSLPLASVSLERAPMLTQKEFFSPIMTSNGSTPLPANYASATRWSHYVRRFR